MKAATRKRLVQAMLLSVAVCGAASCFAAETITLTPNRTTKIDVTGRIKRINVTNEKVADVNPSNDGKAVVVRALEAGSSEIRIERVGMDDLVYNLIVKEDLSGLAADIKELLRDVEGVSVKVVGGRIIVDGKILIKSDYERVTEIVSAYSDSILNLAKLDRTEMNRFVAEAIEKDIGLQTIKVKVQGDTATLEGVVFDADDSKTAEAKAKFFSQCQGVVQVLGDG